MSQIIFNAREKIEIFEAKFDKMEIVKLTFIF